jgi:signal recognition particle subunit SRP54
MFEGLIDKFQIIRRKVLGYGRITKSELDAIFRDIRICLLEADVNYKVVKNFIEELAKKSEGLKLSKSLKPGDLVIKAVYEELVLLLGGKPQQLVFKKGGPTVISLIGLQGVGKTTTAAKLALRYISKKPILVPADAKRPAAAEQLTVLAKRINVPAVPQEGDSIKTIKKVKEMVINGSYGLVIIDTAGRLHIDDDLIQELIEIDRTVDVGYRLLVADGMSGQDAVNQAKLFNDKVGLEGAILTKMDGDARGGAALSIVRAANVPIYYIGTSENLDGLEGFHPDRIAQRILGMGDIAGLVEKVKGLEEKFDREKMNKKIIKGDMDFDDFLEQLKVVRKLGPLSKLAAMIPGVREGEINEKEFMRAEAMINSMTKKERANPDIINGSRRRRIAGGSGMSMAEVNRFVKQFFYARDMMKKMTKGKLPPNPEVDHIFFREGCISPLTMRIFPL